MEEARTPSVMEEVRTPLVADLEGIAGIGDVEEVYRGATVQLSDGEHEKDGEKVEEPVQEKGQSVRSVDVEMEPLIRKEDVVVIDDEEEATEQPAEVVRQTIDPIQKVVEWIPLRTLESETEDEEEASFLQRRPMSIRLALIDEDETPETEETGKTTTQTGETATQEEIDEERLRRERKRKGKEMAKPVQKKSRSANRAVVIREPTDAYFFSTINEQLITHKYSIAKRKPMYISIHREYNCRLAIKYLASVTIWKNKVLG